ncbi:hypothetical protein DSM104299_00030 [Baekduia alba]|uniref:hypothetical protein n=1 Tax=Baekduia alba TaxID=2997333 RepID=UPI0023405FF5|nr:hypothetical protein [Baekduia alba]WCB91359.1 hypothetical protein DSM104299_00030 [Baekduia alba]
MSAAPISLVLLRGLLPDLKLVPGVVVQARVLDPRTLSIAGVRLQAQLPADVVAGQVLALRVEEASAEKLHLRVVAPPVGGSDPAADQAPQVPPTAYQLALPGGIVARIHVEEREEPGRRGGAGAAKSVVVRYDSPRLGRLDVRLDAQSAAVHVSGGDPALAVAEAADRLRDALMGATGGPVLVTVHPRQETVSARA